MTLTRGSWGIVLGLLGAALSLGPACTSTACTPEDHDLGGAPVLTVRNLPGRTTSDGPCANPRLEVIASEAELQAFYEALRVEPLSTTQKAAGTPVAPVAITYPTVDFARERVLVNATSKGEGVTWAVQRQDAAIVGLVACGSASQSACTVQVLAVPALIAHVESRSCDAVGCGSPQRTTVPNH